MSSQHTAWNQLKDHVGEIEKTHLRDLLKDSVRSDNLVVEQEGITLDFSRQRVNATTMALLQQLAVERNLKSHIDAMFEGQKINSTESRAVLHTALRAKANETYQVDGVNVVPEVHSVLNHIKSFSDDVRGGKWVGVTGLPLTNVIAIGIGGSFLGAMFVHEALRSDSAHGAAKAAEGRTLRFLANVDPVDISRAITGLDAARTLVIVISKTFTTAETMLNARTVRDWLVTNLGPNAVAKHMVACSTAVDKVTAFGIDSNNIFPFWDWVGGRYSVTSSVGMLPLSIQYGFDQMQQFLDGAHDMDVHFRNAPFTQNLPVLLGLLGVWNSTFLGLPCRAIAPYSQALIEFAAHIQQVDMESNGKAVDISGNPLTFSAGEIGFGQPGTNGQHSFFQLFHQGRVVPVDFIGFVHSQYPVELKDEPVSNHDELMSNFFAQPDALAMGQTPEELQSLGVSPALVPHKTMPGNRPSNVLLLSKLSAYEVGQLLALYEHRTAVQGFIWNLNSFDQFGVELGKTLAGNVRKALKANRGSDDESAKALDGFIPSTQKLLQKYLGKKSKL